jgi:hypothetical protein
MLRVTVVSLFVLAVGCAPTPGAVGTVAPPTAEVAGDE